MENNIMNALSGMMNSNGAPTELLKAIIAGDAAGHNYVDTLSGGPGLKPESLDPVLKSLEFQMKNIVLKNLIPNHNILNTVHDYNQLVKYGENIGIFMSEGDRPENTDSQNRRKSVLTKYMGVGGKLTLQGQMVKQADGKDPYTREVENKLMLLYKLMDLQLSDGDSSKVSLSFDGILRQHLLGVNEIYGDPTGKNAEALYDTYFNDVAVIDAKGKALTETMIQDATSAVGNDRFGSVSKLITNPAVMRDWAKRYQNSARSVIGLAGSNINATPGFSSRQVETEFGQLALQGDVFFDRRESIAYNKQATSAKAPSTPTAGATPIAVETDSKTEFGSAFAGTYYYVVTAKNAYGESAPLVINTSGQAVASTESVDIQFVDGGGSYPASAYVVYRTEADPTNRTSARYYPLFEVSTSDLSAGHDGAAATKVRDRNRFIANTHSALVMDPSSLMWEYIQLADTMKVEFALTTLAKEFAVVNFGTPVLYMPGKIARIVNIGTDLTD